MTTKKAGIVQLVLGQKDYTQGDISRLVRNAEELGYRVIESVGPWQLYAAEGASGVFQSQQFLAVGRRNGRKESYVIVQGEAPIKAIRSDLEQIADGIMKARGWLYDPILSSLVGFGGFFIGLIGGLKTPIIANYLSDPKAIAAVALSLGTGLYVGGVFLLQKALRNNEENMTRGLSDFAVNYNYGFPAVNAIEKGLAELGQQEARGELYDRIAAGMPREELVKNTRVTITNGVSF